MAGAGKGMADRTDRVDEGSAPRVLHWGQVRVAGPAAAPEHLELRSLHGWRLSSTGCSDSNVRGWLTRNKKRTDIVTARRRQELLEQTVVPGASRGIGSSIVLRASGGSGSMMMRPGGSAIGTKIVSSGSRRAQGQSSPP